jgi:NADH:ubiquinone reductase (H+-translocating)
MSSSKRGKPYPPTAQHAIRQGKVAAENIISAVKGKKGDKDKVKFDYKTKGMMAEIRKRTGVAILFRVKLHGFVAWFTGALAHILFS